MKKWKDFSEIEKEIVKYMFGKSEHSKTKLIPSIEVFQELFKEKYDREKVKEVILGLVSSGIMETYSFHAYLKLTETFKTSFNHNIK